MIKREERMDMNINPAGAGMPRIIGPAGADFSGFSGPDFSSQWRVIPNGVPLDCNPSYNREMLNVISHAPSLQVRCARPRRNPVPATKPLKHGRSLSPRSRSAHSANVNVFARADQQPAVGLEAGSEKNINQFERLQDSDLQQLPSTK